MFSSSDRTSLDCYSMTDSFSLVSETLLEICQTEAQQTRAIINDITG